MRLGTTIGTPPKRRLKPTRLPALQELWEERLSYATLPLFSKEVVFTTQTVDLLVTKEQHISFALRFAHYYWHSTP